FGFSSRAGYAGLGIRDQRSGFDDSGLDQRQKSKLHRRGVTAGIADNARSGNRPAMDFRKAVRRLGEEIGTAMRYLVPAFEFAGVLEPEVGGEIDDLDACADELARRSHGDSMR